MPDWLQSLLGENLSFWLGYITNGKHLAFYSAFQFNLGAAVLGSVFALMCGLGGAMLLRSRFAITRTIGFVYTNIVRGVPDVLFFLFFPLALEQSVEWVWAQRVCTPDDFAASVGRWPPCTDANWYLSTPEYFLLACVSLGIVYGAFAANVISGAMNAVPAGQLEAGRAYGMSHAQVLWRIHIRQMWIYALPGLSNVWMLLIKATSLLSLLQIQDIVFFAERLGAPNYLPRVGLVHPDWRWIYYLILFLFYILITYLSEQGFAWLRRRAGRGLITAEG